ncbi:tRNA (adenosine(37)-N6)-dimethylallyltransferase MiaA [Thermotalea metallivorans]|uniref:tRNA dimethylallyltransferase n=1 Tax=Thermotalea metallivorans TaxID=520762 RepID=A0A140L8J0_9FIRM|nr:tRNA (adenosine(37)-N6)-dimethylallyltransferase MiaA [Thermotalea metallivorans]KXG76865.1 tRNA dimethylallyltransferase [Thermotalea metallivorans]
MGKPLLVIVGPTAVGKTETSIAVAKKLNGEIISADSIQVYKHMDIGSAKPTLAEREGIPHYLMDEIDPRENFSVAEFQSKAKEYIRMIHEKNKLPIIVGGTGLYVNAILYQMDFTGTASNWALRKKLEQEAAMYGNEFLHDKLKEIDPNAAARIHPNNVKRVIRALEVYYEGGERVHDFQNTFVENPEYDYVLIGLNRDRKELYERINKRVDLLIENGLVEEVKYLMNLGLDEENISMKGLGYKEIIGYLKGKYSFDEAVEILKRDTRRYAKRQLTWFRRYEKIRWFDIGHYISKDAFVEDIVKYVEGKLNLV